MQVQPEQTDILVVGGGPAGSSAAILLAERGHRVVQLEKSRHPRFHIGESLLPANLPLFERARDFTVDGCNVEPGCLQTPGYAAALLRAIATFRGLPDDVADAVAARMDRSRIIREGDHRFAIVIEETVLRYRLGDASVMAGQLGSLLSAMDLPAVSLGIVPAGAERSMWPIESFTVFDDERVDHEPLSASVKITAPDEVGVYLKAFTVLHRQAVYGAEARALVVKAIEALR